MNEVHWNFFDMNKKGDFDAVLQMNVANAKHNDERVFWQAHRGGGGHDSPSNTMAAFAYTWGLGGIPEVDVRTTSDGIIICQHNNTLEQTASGPSEICKAEIASLTFEEIRQCDVGAKFGKNFKGQTVPSLDEVLSNMKERSERQIYLDIKDVDLEKLVQVIDGHGLNERVIVASSQQSDCRIVKRMNSGVRTMIWLAEPANQIKNRFAGLVDSGFDGLDQVQLHLSDNGGEDSWRYQLDCDFVKQALRRTRDGGIDLQVFPSMFDAASLCALLDIGIRWFATDEPGRFCEVVEKWKQQRKMRTSSL